MRNAPGEPPHSLQLLRLDDVRLEALARAFVG